MASGFVFAASYVTVTVCVRRSTWTFSTPATRLALAVTRGTHDGQVTDGTKKLTVACPDDWAGWFSAESVCRSDVMLRKSVSGLGALLPSVESACCPVGLLVGWTSELGVARAAAHALRIRTSVRLRPNSR